MTNFASEFKDILALYNRLNEELTAVLDASDPQSLAMFLLQHHSWLEQIGAMDTRIAQLSQNWEKSRNQLDAASRQEAGAMAEAAKTQAIHLLKLCQDSSQKLQIAHGNLQKDLAELGKGARFIKGLKPAKNNYPKFIDSRY